MTEPLPCPFCGFPPDISRDNKVFCGEGSCPTQPMTDDGLTREQAIERWNKRVPVKCGPCAGCGFGDMGMSNEQRCELCS